jgi:hypothetical protein
MIDKNDRNEAEDGKTALVLNPKPKQGEESLSMQF